MIAEATSTHCIWILEDHEVFAKQIRRLISNGVDRMDAIKQVAKERGLAKREVYDELER